MCIGLFWYRGIIFVEDFLEQGKSIVVEKIFLRLFSEFFQFLRFLNSREIENAHVSSASQFSLAFVDEESLVSVRDTQKWHPETSRYSKAL